MKIRAITYFCNPGYPLDDVVFRQAGKFAEKAKPAYEAAGYEVQTVRLATVPFPQMLGEKQLKSLPSLAREFDLLMPQVGFTHGSLGPALPEMPASYDGIPEGVAASKNIFFSGIMADARRGIDLAAIRRCAQVIVKNASIDRNGFANLRFAALANVRPGSPFFPAAYSDGTGPAFAIGTEAADLAVKAFEAAKSVAEGSATLVAEIERHATALAKAASELSAVSGAPGSNVQMPKFLGIDLSLSPFPEQSLSIGTAFERLGVPHIGAHGSLTAAAILTSCIERAKFPRVGFSGLMLPVLEDAIMARRAAEGTLTAKDLLLYSAVCGTGLDTIPLPGLTTVEELVPLLLDLSAMALRLDKQLTARLLPIPHRKVGNPTAFDFAFFANSKVMAVGTEPLRGLLGGGETFPIQAR